MKTSKINYDGKNFASVENSATGEVSSATIFHYHQKDDVVWAEYAGGAIRFGNLTAKFTENDCLEMRYQHLNERGELMTGKGVSTPEILADGRIRLSEKWQWTSGDFSSGESIVEEISSAATGAE
ncbi:MAG: n-acetylglutamate synthase [Acidobacteriota bacterium]|nr:n-acetylglutamate synthase [Acidobacteriota bacterium]